MMETAKADLEAQNVLVNVRKVQFYILKYPIPVLPTFMALIPIAVMIYRMSYLKKGIRFLFYWLCFKVVTDFIMLALASTSTNNLYIANIQIVVLSILIWKAFADTYERPVLVKISHGLLMLSCITFAYDIWRDGIYSSFRYSAVISSILITGLCMMFFYQMLKKLQVEYVSTYPMFWVASALLIYYAPMIILSTTNFYLDTSPKVISFYVYELVPYILESFYLLILGFGLYLEK